MSTTLPVVSHSCPNCGHNAQPLVATQRAVVAAVLDKSGSMQNLTDDVIGGFNKFLADQQALPGEAIMSVVLFDTEVQHLATSVPIDNIPALDRTLYVPSGMTALLDAVGATVKSLEESVLPSDRVIVVVTTDGEENSSRNFSAAKIKDLVEAKRKAGWEFVYLGVGDEKWVSQQAARVGFATSGTYTNTSKGTRAHYGTVSANLSSMRATGASAATMDWNSPDDAAK